VEIKEQLVDEVQSLGGNVGLEAILKRLDVPKEEEVVQKGNGNGSTSPGVNGVPELPGKLMRKGSGMINGMNGIGNGNGNVVRNGNGVH
jgi:geranylgeranyl diphosphate synthase type 3